MSLPCSALRRKKRWSIDDLELLEVPSHLSKSNKTAWERLLTHIHLAQAFDDMEQIVSNDAVENEILTRCYINMMLFSGLLAERSIVQTARPRKPPPPEEPSTLPSTPVGASKRTECLFPVDFLPHTPAPLSENTERLLVGIYFKTRFEQVVQYQGRARLLSGYADQTLGYKHKNSTAGSLMC